MKNFIRGGGILFLALFVLVPQVFAGIVQWSTDDGGNGHWYEAVSVTGGINWTDADSAATDKGGYLATILSGKENSFVFGLVNDMAYWTTNNEANLGPWLGGYQSTDGNGADKNWKWVTEEGWSSYTNWHLGEPSNGNGGTEDFLQFFSYISEGLLLTWNDASDNAQSSIAYIIEYDSNPVPLPGSAALLFFGIAGLVRTLRIRQNL